MPRLRLSHWFGLLALSTVLSLIGAQAFASAAGSGRRAVATAACANADLVPAATNLPQINRALFCLVNQRRVAAGLRRLRSNSHLASAALRHSRDMARTVTYSHIGPGGDTLISRIKAAGYTRGSRSFVTSENLAWEPTQLSTPAYVVAAWMASSVHRGNLLNRSFRDTGIAAVLGPPSHFTQHGEPGTPITEVFGARH